MKRLPVRQVLMALVVEVIRYFWDRGRYRSNKVLRMLHDGWLHHWIDLRVEQAGRSIDKQAKELTPEPEIMPPLYWEQEEGETLLGGPLGYTYTFVDDTRSGADPLQGSEQRKEDGERPGNKSGGDEGSPQ